MDIEHIYATTHIDKIEFSVDKLPQNIGLVTTVQYEHELEKVKAFLTTKGKNAIIGGSILGCYQPAGMKILDAVDACLYVGTGFFHPVGLAVNSGKPVFLWNPSGTTIDLVDQEVVEKIEKKKKGQVLKFHTSKKIGVILSTKSGQATVQALHKQVFGLREKFSDKEFYFFAVNTLDFSELENFPYIDCWVNTMCPRIREDLSVLNIEDLRKI